MRDELNSTGPQRLDREFVRAKAQDRWHSVLQKCGVPGSALTGERTACPGCAGDNFRYLDTFGRGRFVCRAPGRADISGDGFALLAHVLGVTFPEAVRRVAEALRMRELPSRPIASNEPRRMRQW